MPMKLVVSRNECRTIIVDPEMHGLIRAFATKYHLKMQEAAYILLGRSIAKDLGADPNSIKLPNKDV